MNLFHVCALPLNNTAPCHKRGVNGKVDLVIHELKTHTLVEVVEELLREVKGFGGWVFLLYQIIYIIFKNKSFIHYIWKNHLHRTEGESMKVRSTEEYLCQPCLTNWPWKSKLPSPGEAHVIEPRNLAAKTIVGPPKLKEMAFMPIELIGFLPIKVGWFWINHCFLYTAMGLVLIK